MKYLPYKLFSITFTIGALSFLLFGLLFILPSSVSAATCQWIGADYADWDVAGNWSNCGGNVPGSTDTVYLDPGDEPYIDQIATISGLMMFGTSNSPSGITFNYDAISQGPLTVNNDLSMDTYTYITHVAGTSPGGTDTITGRINLLVEGDVGIATTSSITANEKGYPFSAGTGQGCDGGGAGGGGYGGIGGGGYGCASASALYGSFHDPVMYGSGGGTQLDSGYGTSGAGGGTIKLRTEGDLVVYGTISSNGASGSGGNGGGGSGGSVWLYAYNLGGNGTISATGGNGAQYGGGGGGGRIYMDVVSDGAFTGTYTAAAGTTGNAVSGSYPRPTEGSVVTIEDSYWGDENLIFRSSMVIKPSDVPLSYEDITVKANKTVTLQSDTDVGARRGVHFITSNDFILEQGATLSAIGTGHPAGGTGFGTGYDNDGASGGGFGGYGGGGYQNANQGGSIYGKFDFLATTIDAGFITVGSGAGNNTSGPVWGISGAGGGGIWLTVDNNVVMSTGSSILANGQDGKGNNGGGGSGGAILLDIKNQLTGTGTIQANGGNGGPYGGGGGGGRIYIDVDYGDYSFVGPITVNKGINGVNVYMKYPTDGSYVVRNEYGSLEIHSNMTITTNDHPIYYPDIFVGSNLHLIAENSYKTSTVSGSQGIVMEAEGEFFLPGTSSISADGEGHPQGVGLGLGCTADGPGGGGHGGAGTRGYGCGSSSSTYGNANGPISLGSGGGINTSGPGWGISAPGGGAIKIISGGRMTIEGTISANSGISSGNNGAGGAGGSIWLQTYGELTGDGIIRANGGAGGPYAGGGGGGRILIERAVDNFDESWVTANGGSAGSQTGGGTAGNGTITYSDL